MTRPIRIFPLPSTHDLDTTYDDDDSDDHHTNRPIIYSSAYQRVKTDQEHYKERWRSIKDREKLLEIMYNRLAEMTEEMKNNDLDQMVNR